MKENTLYTNQEKTLFTTLENDVNAGNYTPLFSEKLESEKDFFEKVAINTIKKKEKITQH